MSDSGNPEMSKQVHGVFSAPDAAIAEGWRLGPIPGDPFDTGALVEAVSTIRSGRYGDQHSLLIAHGDALIWDEHFDHYDQPEPDERQYNWRRRSTSGVKFHDVQSATKSVLALLTGLALRDGHIGSPDDPVAAYLAEHEVQLGVDQRWQAVTVRHLLEMKAGFEWDDAVHGMPVLQSDDWIAYVLTGDSLRTRVQPLRTPVVHRSCWARCSAKPSTGR